MADILYTEENYNPKMGLKNIYTKLKEIIQKVNTLWSNAPTVTPKVYKALLTQTSTNAPQVVSNGTGANTPLINTLGGTPTITYSVTGAYNIELTGAFPDGKTFVTIGGNAANASAIFTSNRYDTDNIEIRSSVGGALADDLYSETSILIEVYP